MQQVNEKLALLLAADMEQFLLDAVGGHRRGRDVDAHRLLQHLMRQMHDVAGHGGGEEQRLALLRQRRHDAAHVLDEAHVEHAVGLVDDERGDVA